jgi:hypothetical protein
MFPKVGIFRQIAKKIPTFNIYLNKKLARFDVLPAYLMQE